MPKKVDVEHLFSRFRDDEQLKVVVKKARSLLAADSTFFSTTSPNQRIGGIEQPGQLARRFVLNAVRLQAGRLLSINDCHANFTEYCQNRGVQAVQRRFFKQLITDIIREEFGLGVRNDLKDAGGRYSKGWLGLTVEQTARN